MTAQRLMEVERVDTRAGRAKRNPPIPVGLPKGGVRVCRPALQSLAEPGERDYPTLPSSFPIGTKRMPRLEGKIAWVTGAARGISEALARAFVENGAEVYVTDLNDALGEAVAASLERKPLMCILMDERNISGNRSRRSSR